MNYDAEAFTSVQGSGLNQDEVQGMGMLDANFLMIDCGRQSEALRFGREMHDKQWS